MTVIVNYILEKIKKEFKRFKQRRLAAFMGKPKIDIGKMKREYSNSVVFKQEDNFVLYRIIGNDLEPCHVKGQSLSNIKFILDNEPEFSSCEKFWLVNRILNKQEESRIVQLLDSRNQKYIVIPFEESAYKKIQFDASGLPSSSFLTSSEYRALDRVSKQRVQMHLRRFKNLYVMNNNGARNYALRHGRERAKWILPFDGNCYFTAEGFAALKERVISQPWFPYAIVPMARIVDNKLLLEPKFRPEAKEEPQIAFRRDADEIFDEAVPYGRRPKVELLWRLGVPGPWDRFWFDAWDQPRPAPGRFAGQFQTAGWVARLDSGRPTLEVGHRSLQARGEERNISIIATLDRLDASIAPQSLNVAELVFYDTRKIESLADENPDLASELRERAEAALGSGPYSVTDKSSLPPSGDLHDYWHPAPYWWPNPSTSDGLPYVRKDGERMPGTALYDLESGKYDRTRVQQMFDDATILALAGQAFQDHRYYRHAADLLRTWFVEPATRMNPHLLYAQVRRGHDGDVGMGSGIIEFKDIYYLLDAARLIAKSGALDVHDAEAFRVWLEAYVRWLRENEPGQRECQAENNHGVYFDIQVGAIAAFLGDRALAAEVRNRARLRILSQISSDGSQAHELERTRPRHYVCFSLSGWTTLARIVSAFGGDLWDFRPPGTGSLCAAFEWLARAETESLWSDPRESFESDRLDPLWDDCRAHYPHIDTPARAAVPTSVFHPDFGIAPFWELARDT